MRIDHTRIDELLRLVAEKKLDADAAARSLLGIDSRTDVESIQSLVDRLGPPPPEVEEDWKRQIQSIARSWQARENRPLPPLTMSDWMVDAENRVSLAPQFNAINEGEMDAVTKPTLPVTQSAPKQFPATTASFDSSSAAIRPQSRPKQRHRWQVVATSIAVVALTIFLVLANSRQNDQVDSDLTSDQNSSPSHQPSSPSPFDPGFTAQPPSAAEQAVEVQAGVMAMADAGQGLEPPSIPPQFQPDFGFDNPLLSGFKSDFPQPSTTASSTDTNGSDREQAPESIALDRPTTTASDADWDAVAADQPEPDGSTIEDQPVESATPRQAVTLPTIRSATSADDFTVIGVNPLRQAEWDFPNQSNIQFSLTENSPTDLPGEQLPRWRWTDATSGTELATLKQVDQQIVFQWSEQATSNPLARQLAAGRLRLRDSSDQPATAFLRPHLRTSPLRLDATAADSRFNWPLEGPAIFQSPSLNLEANKPDMVDMAWIEPPDPANIRKQVSTLQWTPSGKPSPAIRCRIECRATTKLQMRLRYFAQLDSTLPWQPYSATQLIMALDQVTQLLERRTAELSQIENQYRNATTSEKRSIRPLKDNIEQAVTQLRLVLQKLQQLNILHSAVAATSHLQLSLTTQWPDGPQTILEIPQPDK